MEILALIGFAVAIFVLFFILFIIDPALDKIREVLNKLIKNTVDDYTRINRHDSRLLALEEKINKFNFDDENIDDLTRKVFDLNQQMKKHTDILMFHANMIDSSTESFNIQSLILGDSIDIIADHLGLIFNNEEDGTLIVQKKKVIKQKNKIKKNGKSVKSNRRVKK